MWGKTIKWIRELSYEGVNWSELVEGSEGCLYEPIEDTLASIKADKL
jgi:hypothetical protein